MRYRYEYRTIRTGVDIDLTHESLDIVEIVNMQPDREQFRALVKVWTYAQIGEFSSPKAGDGIHFEDVPMILEEE